MSLCAFSFLFVFLFWGVGTGVCVVCVLLGVCSSGWLAHVYAEGSVVKLRLNDFLAPGWGCRSSDLELGFRYFPVPLPRHSTNLLACLLA